MLPCATCGSHVRAADPACPACGAARSRTSPLVNHTAAAMLLGLVSCVGTTTDDKVAHTGGSIQPEYGVTITDTVTDVTDADTDVDTDTDTDTASHSGDSGN